MPPPAESASLAEKVLLLTVNVAPARYEWHRPPSRCLRRRCCADRHDATDEVFNGATDAVWVAVEEVAVGDGQRARVLNATAAEASVSEEMVIPTT